MLAKIKILGVNITNESRGMVLEYLLKRIENDREKTFIITPNSEMLVYASSNLAYKDRLNTSTIALPDGIGLFFASGLMGRTFKDRITGVDFIEDLCMACENNPLSMGFLGGKAGIVELAAKRLQSKYLWIKVVFAS